MSDCGSVICGREDVFLASKRGETERGSWRERERESRGGVMTR